MRSRRNGFTLVELLVVMLLIAVLLGLLVPSLLKVRRLALLTSCAANMHGIFDAMVVYAGDNGGMLPNASHYNPGGANNGGGCLGRRNNMNFFFGALAATHSVDNMGLFVCPGTIGVLAADVVKRSGLYNTDHSLKTAQQVATDPHDIWCNYTQRWSGRWHKLFPVARMMVAENVGNYEPFPGHFQQIDIHGGTFAGITHNIGLTIGAVGEPSMNVLGSDGSVIRLLDYANLNVWRWDKMLGGFTVPGNDTWDETTLDPDGRPAGLPYYYPCNDRAGDAQIVGRPGHADPVYADYTPYPQAMSDGAWAFWPTFDSILYNVEFLQPWDSGYWSPGNWQNP